MRFAVLLAAGAALVSTSAFAYDTPKALLEAIYQPYLQRGSHADLRVFYSERLNGLLEQQLTDAPSVSPASFNADQHARDAASFNPFVIGDSFFPFDFAIGEPVVLGDSALATVSYQNFGEPSLLSVSLVKEADGWKVDDISSMGSGENWLYSWLLTTDPYAN